MRACAGVPRTVSADSVSLLDGMDVDDGEVPGTPTASSKQRLRWTPELHERFVNAVNMLGGPESELLKLQHQ